MRCRTMIVMGLSALAAVAGCHRTGAQKSAIPVGKESDFFYVRMEQEIGFDMEPRPKEKVQNWKSASQLKKEAHDKAIKDGRPGNTIAFGNFLRDYRAKNPDYSLYTVDKARTGLRRQGRTDVYEDVTDGNIIMDAVVDASNPNHVLCHQKTERGDPKKGPTPTMVYFADGRSENRTDVDKLIKIQELQVCWYYYVEYAMPSFFRTSAEFPLYLPSPFVQGAPPAFLARVKAKSPESLKVPPEARDFNRFRDSLKKAPPALLDMVQSGALIVGVNADLSNPRDVVVCRGTPEPKQQKEDPETRMIIDASATITVYTTADLKGWMDVNKDQGRPMGMK